ncbi:MAG: hypothetical protein A2X94_14800 [Bdellovibrionales bacterium GWB1_55_8]|nr:MAG: hypothetical protein A2X94_14800 [Bdellovibrionales bacterium GWB1_55_8]
MAKEQQPVKPEASSAEPKKQEQPKKGKQHEYLPGMCHSWGCKAHSHRFDFCDEHYDQFKFGLIKKSGEPVPDYDKKFEHYNAWKAKRSARKVA